MANRPASENNAPQKHAWPDLWLCIMPLAVIFDNGYFPVIAFLSPCLYIAVIYLVGRFGVKTASHWCRQSQCVRYVLKYSAYYLAAYFLAFLLFSLIPGTLAGLGLFPLPYLTWAGWFFLLIVKLLQLALFLIMCRLAWLCIKRQAFSKIWE